MKNRFKVILTLLTWMIFCMVSCDSKPEYILIVTKVNEAEGHRHKSIEKGVETLTILAKELDLEAIHNADGSKIEGEFLVSCRAIVFLNTSRDILSDNQRGALKEYIQSGGGFLGIHGASTTEYSWPWYGQLVGAYFVDHPEIQLANMNVLDPNHPATSSLPEVWRWEDEWYNFRDISDNINVLIAVDESSYSGGKHGDLHPIAWYHEYDGGRSFYTALGHSVKSYDDPLFQKHLLGALEYVIDGKD